jgi:predicted acetyltransferase
VTIEVRPLLVDQPDPVAAFDLMSEVDLKAFAEEADPAHVAVERAVFETDRAWLAWDGKEAVGCAAAYSLDVSVPGGTVATGGVTWVGVLPTHRRQGAMRQLLAGIHTSMHETGREPIAALWASQPPIYGRFGYGLATQCLSVVIPRVHGSMTRAPRDPSLRLRLVEPATDRELTQPVYDALRARRPGIPALDERWHARNVADPQSQREGASPLTTVVVESDEGVQGFARYSFKHNWSAGYADGVVNVRRLMAVSPAAEAELWRYLIDFDLAGTVDAWNTTADSPIGVWLDQPRHSKRQLHDALYVKLIDLPAALSARTYADDIDLVLEVNDAHCPWNEGRWRLAGDGTGATCTRTADPVDLSLGVTELGAVYLGGPTLDAMGAAGWVDETSPGSLRQASRAFAHPTAPWSPFVF